METHDDVLRAEVRRALELIGDAAVPSRGFDQLPVPPGEAPSPRRLGLILVGAAAIVALVAGLVWVASVRGPEDEVPAGPEVEQGGLEIVDVDLVLDGVEAELVAFAV